MPKVPKELPLVALILSIFLSNGADTDNKDEDDNLIKEWTMLSHFGNSYGDDSGDDYDEDGIKEWTMLPHFGQLGAAVSWLSAAETISVSSYSAGSDPSIL